MAVDERHQEIMDEFRASALAIGSEHMALSALARRTASLEAELAEARRFKDVVEWIADDGADTLEEAVDIARKHLKGGE